MSAKRQERILIVDTNPLFRERLALELQASGYQAVTANTGEQAFLLLRDRQHAIDWLYTRAVLPVLIDGWILADEYHESHPCRAVVLAGSAPRASVERDVILEEPTPAAVLQAIRNAIKVAESSRMSIAADMGEQLYAA
jgi:CheY-like chemotaxis protein